MAVYWLTFRIKEEIIDGWTPQERRDALYTAVREIGDQKWWIEPTSFVLFGSSHPLSMIAEHCKLAIAEDDDLVLIRALDRKDAVILGTAEDADLFDFMPYCKRS